MASMWPEREQKSHLGRLEALFCDVEELGEEWEDADDVEGLCESLDGPEDAENAEVVEERLMRVWSMFRSDWMTDDLSNLSRIEMVLTISSKECGSALMMAITASSS